MNRAAADSSDNDFDDDENEDEEEEDRNNLVERDQFTDSSMSASFFESSEDESDLTNNLVVT